jgi:hypothetical protein
VAHHAAGTPFCGQRSTVGNGLPSGGLVAHACARLAARQGLVRHDGKQGERNNAAEVPNAGEVSRVRARRHVCMHGYVRVPAAKHGGKPKLSGTRHRNGREKTQAASKGARALRKEAAPAKRPARLDGRLSSDGGYAWWHEAGAVQQGAHKA